MRDIPVLEENIIYLKNGIAVDAPEIGLYRVLKLVAGEWQPKLEFPDIESVRQHLAEKPTELEVWINRCLWLLNQTSLDQFKGLSLQEQLNLIDSNNRAIN